MTDGYRGGVTGRAGGGEGVGGVRGVEGTVGEMGEFGLIAAISERMPGSAAVLLGPGDDAAVVAAPDGQVVATTDVLVEGHHFRRDWSTAADVGHRAAAANLADIAAMGAVPTALLVGLGLPAATPVAWVLGLVDGLVAEATRAGAGVAGGDVVGAETVIVSVTALGDLQGRRPVTRSGARPGDVVAIAGRLGWAAAGLALLRRGFASAAGLVGAHRRPEVWYDEGPRAARLGATAMCDVSDGLLADLGHVATTSGVSIEVDLAAAQAQVTARMGEVAASMGLDPLAWVLTGGDDHALVACFPPGVTLPERWRVVGRVLLGGGQPGVRVPGWSGEGPAGWDHFTDSTPRR